MEALVDQVRQLTSRLAGWVEAQLVQALDDRRRDLNALRSELQVVLDTQMAKLRAEAASAEPADTSAVAEAREQRVRSAMSRLSESVESRLADIDQARQAELDALRNDLRALTDERAALAELSASGVSIANERVAALSASLGRRLDDVAGQASVAGLGVAALRAEVDEGPARIEAFEQRVKAAMGRLTDSVEARLAEEAAGARNDELEQRVKAAVGRLIESVEERLADTAQAHAGETEALEARLRATLDEQRTELAARLDAATADLRARFGPVHQRIEAAEQQQRGAGALVDAKLAEVVEHRRAEFEEVKGELQEALAVRVGEARSEIAVVVSDAHRRFVVSIDELDERLRTVGELAAAAWSAVAGMETMEETVLSDGRRIEALEIHTRRTDARLGEVVDAKLVELSGERGAELDEVSDRFQRQMRAALDAHLAETRAEVALALGEGRTELAEGAARLEERQAALDQQAAKAVSGLDALGASVETALQEAESRLGEVVNRRLDELDEVSAEVAEARATTDAAVAALSGKVARSQDQVQKRVAGVTEQVDSMVRAAAAETSMLAPLRSDVRQLQRQVAELTELLDELRPKRKPPAAKAPARKVPAARAKAPRRRSSTQ